MLQQTEDKSHAQSDGPETLADILPRLMEALEGRRPPATNEAASPVESDAEFAAAV